jgi:hypothetical protein
VWELPTGGIQSPTAKAILHGFQVSTIVSLLDGRPYSGAINGSPGSPSPSGVTSGIIGVGGSSRVPWVGRNIYTNPGVNSVDVRLARTFTIKERVRLAFVAEAFNVANRYQITSINTTQYSFSGINLFPQSAFGSTSGSGTNLFGARQIQLGTRVTF